MDPYNIVLDDIDPRLVQNIPWSNTVHYHSDFDTCVLSTTTMSRCESRRSIWSNHIQPRHRVIPWIGRNPLRNRESQITLYHHFQLWTLISWCRLLTSMSQLILMLLWTCQNWPRSFGIEYQTSHRANTNTHSFVFQQSGSCVYPRIVVGEVSVWMGCWCMSTLSLSLLCVPCRQHAVLVETLKSHLVLDSYPFSTMYSRWKHWLEETVVVCWSCFDDGHGWWFPPQP